jgi:hypothetical protein
MFIDNCLNQLSSFVGTAVSCVHSHAAPTELRSICLSANYKHLAPTELNTIARAYLVPHVI